MNLIVLKHPDRDRFTIINFDHITHIYNHTFIEIFFVGGGSMRIDDPTMMKTFNDSLKQILKQ